MRQRARSFPPAPRPTGKPARLLAGAMIGAALMAASACGGDQGPASSPESSEEASGESVDTAGVASLKVCELVDLQPLLTTLAAPGYEYGPEDIPVGSGVDPAGPQCFAQMKLPPLRDAAGVVEELVPARLQVSVVPLGSIDKANGDFDGRVAEVTSFEGPWPRT